LVCKKPAPRNGLLKFGWVPQIAVKEDFVPSDVNIIYDGGKNSNKRLLEEGLPGLFP
jgi:hypothetical protein